MQALPNHPQAKLYLSEVVPLVMLFTLEGVGEHAFYQWLAYNYLELFPQLPECTRLFRLFKRIAIEQDEWQEFEAMQKVYA